MPIYFEWAITEPGVMLRAYENGFPSADFFRHEIDCIKKSNDENKACQAVSVAVGNIYEIQRSLSAKHWEGAKVSDKKLWMQATHDMLKEISPLSACLCDQCENRTELPPSLPLLCREMIAGYADPTYFAELMHHRSGDDVIVVAATAYPEIQTPMGWLAPQLKRVWDIDHGYGSKYGSQLSDDFVRGVMFKCFDALTVGERYEICLELCSYHCELAPLIVVEEFIGELGLPPIESLPISVLEALEEFAQPLAMSFDRFGCSLLRSIQNCLIEEEEAFFAAGTSTWFRTASMESVGDPLRAGILEVEDMLSGTGPLDDSPPSSPHRRLDF